MVGLQLSSGTAPRPPSFLSGVPTPLGAGLALEQLKKTADRLVEEQQSNKNATEAYRLKMQEAQSQLSSLQQAYTHEKTENAQLKAKIKDDEQQIEHVTSKVSMVETMHDGLRLALEGLRRDVKDVDMYRSKLSESFSTRFADCEVSIWDDLMQVPEVLSCQFPCSELQAFGDQLERLQAAKLATEQELSSAIHHHTELEQNIVQMRTSMQHSAQTHQDERDRLVKALQQAETCVTEQRKACEDVRAEWSATQHELSMLHSTHLNDTDKAEKQISKLENELQAAMLHVSRVESDLKDSLAKQARAEDTIESLTTAIEGLQNQLHAGTEQINNLTSELQSKTAAFDALTAEHQSSIDKCQLLCTSLQQSEEQMQARCAELEQAVTASESEEIAKDALSCELEQKAKEITELQTLIATAGEVAAKAQVTSSSAAEPQPETHAASIAALQAELASSKQETVSAKADAEMLVKAAGMAADKKVIRLTERTAKELDDFCKKSKSEAEKEQQKMQSQVHALEDVRRDLEAKSLQEQQKLEAAVAQNKQLCDQIQAVTHSLEEKYSKAVSEADQKLSLLQVALQLDKEVNVLKEKQQLELQQAQQINTKQQAAMEELEKGIGQLKLEQQERIAKHAQDKEALLSSAEEARNAAVQEVQMVMDAKVKSMNEDLAKNEKSLQDVTQQLQRSEMSVHAAHMELDSLKAHAREQEAVIADMREELRKNQNVLGAISKCARKAGQSPATKEVPPSRRKAFEKKGAVKDSCSIPRTQKRYTPNEHLDRPDIDSDHHHKPQQKQLQTCSFRGKKQEPTSPLCISAETIRRCFRDGVLRGGPGSVK
ncbi:hypothetical protein ABBQ32_012157 [Trebouxia sp. C0010 RCD-2024]